MSSYVFSSKLYKIWFVYAVIGTVISTAAERVITEALFKDLLSATEIYSAVWFIILGLAIRKVGMYLGKEQQ